MTSDALQDWSTTAINLPDHADNEIHTDEGALAAGFESALVAGTTVYAYLTHVAAAAWGLDWVAGGGGELRLRRPVFDRDPVDCVVTAGDDGPVVTAQVAGDARASLDLWKSTVAPAMRDGEQLDGLDLVLSDEHIDYGVRCGDDLALYVDEGIAPPVTWVNLANSVFKQTLVTGPWIHTRSRIHHEGVGRLGDHVHIDAVLLERFDSRAGERALVDMRFYAADEPVATIEHEAIIALP